MSRRPLWRQMGKHYVSHTWLYDPKLKLLQKEGSLFEKYCEVEKIEIENSAVKMKLKVGDFTIAISNLFYEVYSTAYFLHYILRQRIGAASQ